MRSTNLPVAIPEADRRILEQAAYLKRLRLSTWVRVAAVEHSNELINELIKADRGGIGGDKE